MVDTAAVDEDAVLTGSLAGSDVDVGDTLSYALDAPVAGLTLNADGSYSFDAADPAYQHLSAGDTDFVIATYTVTDGQGATDSGVAQHHHRRRQRRARQHRPTAPWSTRATASTARSRPTTAIPTTATPRR